MWFRKKPTHFKPIKGQVSIVTVTFNAKLDLEKTIQTIITQDYEDIEFIIIDGGSTDGTIEIIQKHQKDIAYWVSEPDNGIYDAMNKGINKATGEWKNCLDESAPL
ncbi:MAG: glycosyltransferase [Sulfurovaceae bacterium]